MTDTVIGYVLRRLKDLGVDAVFGVPGDFAFGVADAIAAEPGLDWIGCCNELNAGYAADGYARVRGFGAVSTTYGVGELSAINAVAGSYAEHLPVFHLTGMPAMPVQNARSLVHHTLGDGEFDLFKKMADTVVCASAIMTPHNAAHETERLIAAAVYHRRPVYMAFPSDLVDQPILMPAAAVPPAVSTLDNLSAACDAISAALASADTACVLPGTLITRLGLQPLVTKLLDGTGLPFATMFADKAVLDETHPGYIGMYDGALMDEAVRAFVETCDRVVLLGTSLTDFNSGAFTANLDSDRMIDVGHHCVRVGQQMFRDVEFADVLAELTARLGPSPAPFAPPRSARRAAPSGAPTDAISADVLYTRWQEFLRPDDVIVAETGTVSMGLAFTRLPSGAQFFNQTLWGSIGWATPAAFGAAVADPGRRVVLFTGEGSHQLTAQEISQFARRGLTPIVFVLNNDGYLIERLLCRDPAVGYNDVASWNYTALPHALGCDDWFTAKVTTQAELDAALHAASTGDVGAYVEVITDPYAAPELLQHMHQHLDTLYGPTN